METRISNRVDVNFNEFTDKIARIIPDLAENNNYQKKIRLRRYLIDMGKEILPQINKLLGSKNIQLRKEASKIIEILGDKDSIPVLVSLLGDDEGSIRWIAAEGLIHIGRERIVPLLNLLIQKGDDYYLKLGARHAFLGLFTDEEKKYFKPLLLSLKSYNSISFLASVEAYRALMMFKYQSLDIYTIFGLSKKLELQESGFRFNFS